MGSCLKFIVFWLMTAPPFVIGCIVHPTSVVVTVGEKVLLTCTTQDDGSITSWDLGINTLKKSTIFTAPVYKRDGTTRTPEKVADGYFVTYPADNKTTLHMNKIILSQAGLYVCICSSRDTAVTTVVVLVSTPTFTTNYRGVDGESVTFSCYLSFNASSDVSCGLKIEDASGSTVARINQSILKNGLVVCNLERTIIADASSDQWHTCKVTLNNKEDIIYSRVLNTTVEWQPVSSTANVLSTGGDQAGTASQFANGDGTPPKLAIGLSVIIFAVVIVIAVIVYFIIRSRERDKTPNRQHSNGQPTEMSSDRPHRPPQCHRYDMKNIGRPISKDAATPCFDDVHQDKKSLKEYELTVCDNDLYSTTSKQLDPSDGYFAEEAIYHEI